MSTPRRKCRLAETCHDVDLRQYRDIIVATINTVTPNKKPLVFKDYFSTDPLTQSEAVALGRALSQIKDLKIYGKTVLTFRLFNGKIYASEEETKSIEKGSH